MTTQSTSSFSNTQDLCPPHTTVFLHQLSRYISTTIDSLPPPLITISLPLSTILLHVLSRCFLNIHNNLPLTHNTFFTQNLSSQAQNPNLPPTHATINTHTHHNQLPHTPQSTPTHRNSLVPHTHTPQSLETLSAPRSSASSQHRVLYSNSSQRCEPEEADAGDARQHGM
jgi:hypothetical protein